MSTTPKPLPPLLMQVDKTPLELDQRIQEDLKKATRFWFGKADVYWKKANCIHALTGLFDDPARLQSGLEKLSDQLRMILGICKWYGGAMTGKLLHTELVSRGIVIRTGLRSYMQPRDLDEHPIYQLCFWLFLLPPNDWNPRHYFYTSDEISVPKVRIHPALMPLIKSVAPLPWQGATASATPLATAQRLPAEIALDLGILAQALGQLKSWKTNRGGTLNKSLQSRLRKLFPDKQREAITVPAPESLYYEILRGLGAVFADNSGGIIDLAVIDKHLALTAHAQAWCHARAWINAQLWQDGIGVVAERESFRTINRIEPQNLISARELLVWALSRMALLPDGWIDLEGFLSDLFDLGGADSSRFHVSQYSWVPEFPLLDTPKTGNENYRSYWFQTGGTWAANVLMGTMVYLGLVERGDPEFAGQKRPCFRLTELGRAVFGASDAPLPQPTSESKFLTVQPNYDVLAYLDQADASAIGPLARFGTRTSPPGNIVQTFVLTSDSIYHALESGLTLEQILQFLQSHGKMALPANVSQSLAEWGRKREALVIRENVILAAFPPDQMSKMDAFTHGRPVGKQFVVLPKLPGRDVHFSLLADHSAFRLPIGRVNEEGRLVVTKTLDSINRARLAQFADPVENGWQISAASVGRGRRRGMDEGQIRDGLHFYLEGFMPGLMELAIQNWAGGSKAFLGDVLMLHIPQMEVAQTLRDSERFRAFLAEFLPPSWFRVPRDQQDNVKAFLKELGFDLIASFMTQDPADGIKTKRGRKEKL